MPTFPLLVPPVDFSRVEKLLGKIQGVKLTDSSGLSQLHDTVIRTFSMDAETAMWEGSKAKFLEKLPDLLSKLASSTRVSAEELRAEQARTAEARNMLDKLRAELEALHEQNRELHAAKTAEEADKAMAPKNEVARFKAAVLVANEALGGLPRAVRLAIYEDFGNDATYRPEYDSYDGEEAERARKDDLLDYDEDAGGYQPNRDDPSVEEAYDAVYAVFHGGWSEDLTEWFRNEYQKNLRSSSRAAWDVLDLL